MSELMLASMLLHDSKHLLKRALPILEENASMTEHPDDAELVAEVKKYLGVE